MKIKRKVKIMKTKELLDCKWRKVYGYDVYVVNGKVKHGMIKDHNGQNVSAYPYRKSRHGGYSRINSISLEAFRSGVKRGSIIMK